MKDKIISIKLNDVSKEVTSLHKILRVLGYDISKQELIAGKAGNDTKDKIRDFQKESKIKFSKSDFINKSTYEAIIKRLNEKGLTSGGIVFRINGTVYNNKKEVVKSQELIAYEVGIKGVTEIKKAKKFSDLNKEGFDFLDTGVSDGNGDYIVELYTWQFKDIQRKKASIVVFACNGDEITGYSGLINTKEHSAYGEARNIPVYIKNEEKSTEFELLMKKLNEYLKEKGIKLSDFINSPEQIKFASSEIEEEYNKIRTAASSEKLAEESKDKLSKEILYGLGRMDVSLNPLSFYNMKDDDLKNSILESIKMNIIKKELETKIDSFIKELNSYSTIQILESKKETKDNSLDDLLSIALPNKDQRKAFIKSLKEFSKEKNKDFWGVYLPSLKGFEGDAGKKLIKDLKFLQQLVLITGYNLPLINELKTISKKNKASEFLEISKEDWKEIIKKTSVPEYIKGETKIEKINNYAQQLENIVISAFPTQKIALMIRKDELKVKDKNVITTVFESFEKNNIDIRKSFIMCFDKDVIEKTYKSKPEELKQFLKIQKLFQDNPKTKEEFLKIQRLFMVSDTIETMSVLMNSNLDSAYSISRIPQKNFISKYEKKLGSAETARAVHRRASFILSRTELKYSEIFSLLNQNYPKALDFTNKISIPTSSSSGVLRSTSGGVAADSAESIAAVIRKLPTFTDLFGSPDMCECKDCRSVFSPGAYFVDLLQFLEMSSDNTTNALEEFKKRRPDLLELKLTCENAKTVIPYIDLALEVMEYYTVFDTLDVNAAYNTEDVTADELRANPQNFKIDAYEKINDAVYPFSLPFHQPLDAIRAYSSHLKTDRYNVMGIVNKSPSPVEQQEIFSEYLGMSKKEYDIFTDTDLTSDKTSKYYGYPGDASLNLLSGEILPEPPAPRIVGKLYGIFEFLHRTGLKYTDVVELFKTKFINPDLHLLTYLENLFFNIGNRSEILPKLKDIKNGVSSIVSGDEIDAALSGAGVSISEFNSWLNNNYDKYNSVLTLYEKESSCNLEKTLIKVLKEEYDTSYPKLDVSVLQWSRIHRFIRLWRKLKLSLNETDLILESVGNGEINQATMTNLFYAINLSKEAKIPVNQLSVLWGNIETYGEKSLYKKLFLNKSVQVIDAVFKPDKFGDYLTDKTKKIDSYIPYILSAFRISNEDFDAIIQNAEIDDNGTKRFINTNPPTSTSDILNIHFLSVIYRYTVLSKALKMKVKEICLLMKLFDIKPFSILEITTLGTTTSYKFKDINPEKTLKFYKLALSVKKMKFKPEILDYIFNGNLSSESNLGLDSDKAIQSARLIREALNTIEIENPEIDALPYPLTSEILKSKLINSFDETSVNHLIGLIESKQEFSVITVSGLSITIANTKFTYNNSDGTLLSKGIMTIPERINLKSVSTSEIFKTSVDNLFEISRTSNLSGPEFSVITVRSLGSTLISSDSDLAPKYKYINATGRISFKGVMSVNEREALKALSTDPAFDLKIDELYSSPDRFIENNFGGIFADINEVKKILFNHPVIATGSTPTTPSPEKTLCERLNYIYTSYLPFLKLKLRTDAITQFISSVIGLSEDLTRIISRDDISAIIDLLTRNGFSAEYFNDDTFGTSGAGSAGTRTDETVNFNWGTSSPATFAGTAVNSSAYSVRWQGFIFPPSGEEYTIKVETNTGNSVTLYIDDIKEISGTIRECILPLNPSNIYKFVLEFSQNIGNGGITLWWKTPTKEWEIIPSSVIYPHEEIDDYKNRVKLYHRAAKFITCFKLSDREVFHFKNYNSDFANINFSLLTKDHWIKIRDYSELKNSLPQSGFYLTDIFRSAYLDASGITIDSVLSIVSLATGWDFTILKIVVNKFSYIKTDFKNEIALSHLNEIFSAMQKTGVSFETLIEWGKTRADFDDLYKISQILKNSVKAKYEEKEWLDVAKDINNKLRENQKQALINFLLTKKNLIDIGVKDADGLYEYFLIDVQMGACMDATRILMGNTAIQMFVQRILLNLEIGIKPNAIATDRWEWMKNYRVWEANRKVFYYPENWLEPEWRDDRSPFFKELESELVQNDITERTVDTAFRNYLTKLDQVSNLDVCGMYQDNDDNKKLHIFARTHNAPYIYFYRIGNPTTETIPQYTWTAWEKVQVDIRGVEDGNNSGVHIVPVVWKNRLFIFWPEFLEKAEEKFPKIKIPLVGTSKFIYTDKSIRDTMDETPNNLKPEKYWEMKLGWSEYTDGKWSPKQLSKENLELRSNTISSLKAISLRTEKHGPELYILPYERDQDNDKWKFDEYFILTNIESKLKVDTSDETPFLFLAATRSSNNFQKNYFDNLWLMFANKNYLNRQSYNLLFSNSLLEKEEAPKDPFFYSTPIRTYFVRSTGSNIIELITKDKSSSPTSNSVWATIGSKDDYKNISVFHHGDTERNVSINRIDSEMDNLILLEIERHELLPAPDAETIRRDIPIPEKLEFHTFYHPYINKFINELNRNGIPELMKFNANISNNDSGNTFNIYNPDFTRVVKAPLTNEYREYINAPYTYYKENICFDYFGANSLYNWELFFHAPLYIATRLSKNGKFKEAMKWFHFIFDPTTDEAATDSDSTARFWKVLPFKSTVSKNLTEYLRDLLNTVTGTTSTDSTPDDVNPIISEWRKNPFKPHLIAKGRPEAYMKYTFEKYIENIVEWADTLFRNFSYETVNEALQLYVLAGHLLGRRPESVPSRFKLKAETYNSIKDYLDDSSNALRFMENLIPFSSELNMAEGTDTGSITGGGLSFYFCIPGNEKILEMWNTVEDRLYKIRHCLDIDGVPRSLALFAPSIDPSMLINAAAKGLSLGSILADLSSPPPIHRFTFLIQKANEFCNEVKSLGGTLLSTLEKKDGEELGRIRASHETHINEMMMEIKTRQFLDAKANREALLKSRESAEFRLKHYNSLMTDEDLSIPGPATLDSQLTTDSQLPPDTSISKIETDVDVSLVKTDKEKGVKLIPKEKYQLDELGWASNWQNLSSVTELLAVLLYTFPDLSVDGKPLGVGAGTKIGGANFGNSVSSISKSFQLLSSLASNNANQASILSGYIRREQDWTFQANLAAKEIIQIDKQIVSADIKIQIAKKELEIHKTQIENVKQVEEYLKNKFTNQELYQWMKEQLFAVYKQSYNLAFDMAKKVEKCYKFETGDDLANFVQYGYWDSSMQGLCSGENLQLALKQMEKSYFENNKREFELTKNISLGMLNPIALQKLRTTGKCNIVLREELFDMDYQGHFYRRIKSVSLTIPCIAGPYTTISCTLRLQKNTIRLNASQGDQYEHNNEDGIWVDDDRFRDIIIPVKSIATSTAQRDSGMFELSFRDERYLPFEGAGVISEWQIELTTDSQLRQFDYNTISDVILHMSYTAREDAGLFRDLAVNHLKDYFSSPERPLLRMFSLKHEFPSEWHKFLHPAAGSSQKLDIKLNKNHFPFFAKDRKINIEIIRLFIRSNKSGEYKFTFTGVLNAGGPLNSGEIPMPENPSYQNMQEGKYEGFADLNILDTVSLQIYKTSGTLLETDPDEISDSFLVLHYSLTEFTIDK